GRPDLGGAAPLRPPRPRAGGTSRRSSPANRHQAGTRRARAHPPHARSQPPQQNKSRRSTRRHAQNPPQQAPTLRSRSREPNVAPLGNSEGGSAPLPMPPPEHRIAPAK